MLLTKLEDDLNHNIDVELRQIQTKYKELLGSDCQYGRPSDQSSQSLRQVGQVSVDAVARGGTGGEQNSSCKVVHSYLEDPGKKCAGVCASSLTPEISITGDAWWTNSGRHDASLVPMEAQASKVRFHKKSACHGSVLRFSECQSMATSIEQRKQREPSSKFASLHRQTACGTTIKLRFTALNGAPLWHRVLACQELSFFFSTCIIVNCVVLGLEAQMFVTRDLPNWVENTVEISDHVLTTIFMTEICLKVYEFRWKFFCPKNTDERMMCFDSVIVLLSVITSWIIPLVTAITGVSNSRNQDLRNLQTLKSLRLLRCARLLRSSPMFHDLWMIIRGLFASVKILFWTLLVLFFVTYTFSIVGCYYIVTPIRTLYLNPEGNTAEENQDLAYLMDYLGSLPNFMFTLNQALLADSFHGLLRKIIVFVPGGWIYFYSYFLIGNLVLLNLVTAIIVDNASETQKADRHAALSRKNAERGKIAEELSVLFTELDSDGSGFLSRDEFQNSFEHPVMCMKWNMLDISSTDLADLFDMLKNTSGEIELHAFLDGLMHMEGPAMSKDFIKVSNALEIMVQKVGKLDSEVKSVHTALESVLQNQKVANAGVLRLHC